MAQSLAQTLTQANVQNANCPSRGVLNHVCSRWGVLVLFALQEDKMRFSELRKCIGGVSERMLSQTLKFLEQDGIVHRHAHDVVPPHVEYWLTDLGLEVAEHVTSLALCVEQNLPRVMAAREKHGLELSSGAA